MNESTVEAYLNRIGAEPIAGPTLVALTHLNKRHLLTVPFENLSVRWGEPIDLVELALIEKIVARRRGGFCYELNGAFGWLLRRLGFAVTRLSAGVYRAEQNRFGPDFDHMALLVNLDEPYLVDVGFGDSARMPVSFSREHADGVGGRYRIIADPETTGRYQLQRRRAEDWEPQYRFGLTPHGLADYGERCRFHCTSPESTFTRRLVCTLATEDGRITLADDGLTITTPAGRLKEPLDSPAVRRRALWRQFGIKAAGEV